MGEDDVGTCVDVGDWLAELSLWTRWGALGDCRAHNETRLVDIDAKAWEQRVQRHADLWDHMILYCRCLYAHMDMTKLKDLSDVMTSEALRIRSCDQDWWRPRFPRQSVIQGMKV